MGLVLGAGVMGDGKNEGGCIKLFLFLPLSSENSIFASVNLEDV